jgi:hypothetical protein
MVRISYFMIRGKILYPYSIRATGTVARCHVLNLFSSSDATSFDLGIAMGFRVIARSSAEMASTEFTSSIEYLHLEPED